MRLRHIEIFQAIRQTGSVSGAAQLLHVSQPAVTKVLQHAEQQLGFPLFQRVRGKLQPTPEALELEREVDKVTESLQGVRRLAQSLRRAPGHSLRIGATPALALSLLPPAIHEWTGRYPDIVCELSSAHSRELVQNLLMREIDVALTLQQPDHPALKAQALASGVLVALAPAGYWPLEDEGKPLPLAALAGAQPSRRSRASGWPPSSTTTMVTLHWRAWASWRAAVSTRAISVWPITNLLSMGGLRVQGGFDDFDPVAHGCASSPIEVGLAAYVGRGNNVRFTAFQRVQTIVAKLQ